MTDPVVPERHMPGFGLRRDSPDRRDRALYGAVPNIDSLPDRADTSALLPAVMDQRVSSACTGYSGANTLHAVMVKDGHRRPFVPSPVFLYREARVLGGYVEEDMGAEIRNVFKAANRLGLPPMSNWAPRFGPQHNADPQTGLWPEGSIWLRKPPPSVYADAERRQVLSYYRLSTLNDLLKCLADGWPAAIGVTVFRSWYGPSGPLYNIPDPGPHDRDLGGHAITAYGYDKASRRIFCRNQWGVDAHQGKPDFTISFDYYSRFGSDTWTGRFVEGGRTASV